MQVTIPGSVLFQLLSGFLEAGPGINEIALVSTDTGGDPALFRVGGITGAGGGLAGDIHVGEPDPSNNNVRRREMVVLLQYKKDERTRGRDDIHYGELTGHIRGPASERYPDGLMPVFLALHDYVWIKGISPTPEPVKPWLDLPPPVTPPPPPVDPPLITPEERAERVLDVAAMQQEWPGMDLNNVESYLQGRSSPSEFHAQNANRAGFHEPTLHRLGRPY